MYRIYLSAGLGNLEYNLSKYWSWEPRTFSQYWSWEPRTLSQYWSWEPIEKDSQKWTGEPIEPFPSTGLGVLQPFSSIGLENIYNLYSVLHRGTNRTFSQYWTWELIEPFHRTGLGNLEYFPSTALEKLER